MGQITNPSLRVQYECCQKEGRRNAGGMLTLIDECADFLDVEHLHFLLSMSSLSISRFEEYKIRQENPRVSVLCSGCSESSRIEESVMIDYVQTWNSDAGKRFRIDKLRISPSVAREHLMRAVRWLEGGDYPLDSPGS